jgi:hypothetical protein
MGKISRLFWGRVAVLCALCGSALVLMDCAPTVTIDSTRSPQLQETIDPLAVVIFEGNTGSDYTQPLKRFLIRELAAKRIRGRVEIIAGADFDDGSMLMEYTKGMRGLVLVQPVGGTSYMGSLTQILYDVTAFQLSPTTPGEGKKVWRARINTSSGAYGVQIDARLEQLAEDLVQRLVAERVVASR